MLVFASACHTWRVVPLRQFEAGKVDSDARLRLQLEGEARPLVMKVESMSFPEVTGTAEGAPGKVTVDLRKATRVEVWSVSGWRTVGLVAGVTVAAVGAFAVLIILTKSSCPFVYADGGDGLRFVGEAYPGATSRATQREDLLPLPPLGDHPALVLSNEAHETQFTDLLEVVVADHAAGQRALATHDAKVLFAGPGRPPRSAEDLEGRDLLPLVREVDGLTWQTDLETAARKVPPPSREGMVLTFASPGPLVPAALELEAGNTPWLDVVFGRFFALLGDRLEGYLDRADQPESREGALAWREREGVDLKVEVERGGLWERVAVVPSAGPASLRHLAVPLPPTVEPEVRVRLSGGVGFWRVDEAALAPIGAEDPRVAHFGPTRAVDGAGADVRSLLAAADGRFQVLGDRGERVDLRFELPPPGPGLERGAFLRTSGYYRVHRPPQAVLSRDTLYRLRDEPGSLSRFSIELFQRYEKVARAPAVGSP
jgi:hypothetical protein